ncbi:Uncharacterised protein [Mycobacteroides abscessus subsp. abscessus]|nr:Uncharacterised protein [Mycobacteroides abscessus subsp. abscessus]
MMPAGAPWRMSASRGPPTTTTKNTPWMRPRTSALAACSNIVCRNAAETQ